MIMNCLEYSTRFLALLALATVCSTGSRTKISDTDLHKKQKEAKHLSKFINAVLRTYDKKLRPNAGGDAVEVLVEAKVVSFGDLKEASMEFSLDIFFRQWWHDPRFAHNFSIPFNMAADATKIFWTPDTYFVNVKNSNYHRVTRDNMRVKIDPDGRVYFSTRITIVAQCEMNFRLFPMDTQYCALVIESYAYTAAEVNYTWKQKPGSTGIEIVSQEMAQYNVLGFKTETKELPQTTSFASLKVTFSFKRRLEFFIFSVFTPAVILVILSWCCFWISRQAVPARVSLGITTILTTILLSSSVNRDMPKVSYMKSIDYFLLTNFGFIFMSFFEYVIVLNTNPTPTWWKRFTERFFDRTAILEDIRSEAVCPYLDKRREPIDMVTKPSDPRTITRQRKTDPIYNRKEQSQNKAIITLPVHWVDYVSRILFPFCYFTFLTNYWMTNLNASEIQPT